jgi:hypothetical protein
MTTFGGNILACSAICDIYAGHPVGSKPWWTMGRGGNEETVGAALSHMA